MPKFRQKEIEKMEAAIKAVVASETETQSAWRLRLVLESMAQNASGKHDKELADRQLALYEYLTEDDKLRERFKIAHNSHRNPSA